MKLQLFAYFLIFMASLFLEVAFARSFEIHDYYTPLNIDPIRLKVDQAFKDSTNNIIVQFKPLGNIQTHRLFWLPATDRTGIYQLHTNKHNGSRLEYQIDLQVPDKRNSLMLAKVVVEGDKLSIQCERGPKQCFTKMTNTQARRHVLKPLRSGKLDLYALSPQARQLEGIFQVEDGRIIAVDSARFGEDLDMKVYMGPPENIESVPVKEVLFDAREEVVKQTGVGKWLVLDRGKTLFLPSPTKNPNGQAFWGVGTMPTEFLKDITHKDIMQAIRNNHIYRSPPLRTPFEACGAILN